MVRDYLSPLSFRSRKAISLLSSSILWIQFMCSLSIIVSLYIYLSRVWILSYVVVCSERILDDRWEWSISFILFYNSLILKLQFEWSASLTTSLYTTFVSLLLSCPINLRISSFSLTIYSSFYRSKLPQRKSSIWSKFLVGSPPLIVDPIKIDVKLVTHWSALLAVSESR